MTLRSYPFTASLAFLLLSPILDLYYSSYHEYWDVKGDGDGDVVRTSKDLFEDTTKDIS